MKEKTAREIALELLIRIEKEGGFSHLLISNAINQYNMDSRDETLLTELVYGTTERKMTLDYFLEDYNKQPKKLDNWVRMLLRMSVYQFAYLDKVPAFAIINEAVNIAKRRGHRGIASFVNGVLRAIDRHGLSNVAEIEDSVKRLSIETSHPEWLIERWMVQYGEAVTAAICRENIAKQPLTIRINKLQTNRETVLKQLTQAGIEATPSPWVNEAIIIGKGNIFRTGFIENGDISVQDQSSLLAAKAVDARKDMKVLDACSAPGGKATFIGETMNNTGEIHAYDLHQNKTKLIQKHAKRLGLTNIQVKAKDARTLQTVYEAETFDRVLVDAPCSGFGVIRQKPDIKYQKKEKDILHLQQVQQAILDHVAPLVKIGGKLIYSTCTIEQEENERQVDKFLNNHSEFKIDETFIEEMKQFGKGLVTTTGIQLFPQSLHSDGFFITRLEKLPE